MTSSNSDTVRYMSDIGQKRISSFPSRQRRMGPAPLASFEDLSMDKPNSDSSPEDKKQLPDIQEGPVTPIEKEQNVPSSPRIKVSVPSMQCDTDSKESTPEKELFKGYQKSAFCDQSMSDLRAECTDELIPKEQVRKKRRIDKPKSSKPDGNEDSLNINELIRKGSSSSVISDTLQPTSAHSSRLSSLGSISSPVRRSPSPHKMKLETSFCGNKPIQNPSIDIEDPPVSLSSTIAMPTSKKESPIKQKLPIENTDLETNEFRNITDQKAREIAAEEAQIKKSDQYKSLQRRQDKQRRQAEHQEYQQRYTDQASEFRSEDISSKEAKNDANSLTRQNEAKSPRLAKKVPSPQVPVRKESAISSSSNETIKATNSDDLQQSTRPSRDSRKKRSDKSNIGNREAKSDSSYSSLKKGQKILSPETPESPSNISGRKSPFSHFMKSAKNELRSRSRSRSRSKSRDRDLNDDTHDRRKKFSLFKTTKKEEKKKKDKKEKQSDVIAKPEIIQIHHIGSPQIPGRTTPADIYDGFIEINSKTQSKPCSPNPSNNSKETLSTFKPNDGAEVVSPRICGDRDTLRNRPLSGKSLINSISNTTDISHVDPQNDPDALSISESEKFSEIEELKKKVIAGEQVESPNAENKGLVSQDSFEDDELPFVPTTLPQERSALPPMIPVRERQIKLKMTQSIDRPRSAAPMQPSSLEAYKQSSQELLDSELDKMTITIKVPPPGSIKVLPMNVPKRQSSKSWEDFCQEGLKSPRELRQQHKLEQEYSQEEAIPPPPPPPPPPSQPTAPSEPLAKPQKAPAPQQQNWIDFSEIPSIVLKPVRQIKSAPVKRTPSEESKDDVARKPSELIKKFERKSKIEIVEDPIIVPEPEPVETPKDDSSENSSESEDKLTSSSSEDLEDDETEENLRNDEDIDLNDNSDLERLLAPVNECISKLSFLSANENIQGKKSPIPDNWEDFLLPPQPGRRSRLSSVGSETGSLCIGRSPSPSHMILETSFCGSQPIDDPAMAEPNVPIPVARKFSGISLGDLSPFMMREERGSIQSTTQLLQPDRSSILSDSSNEGGSPKEVEGYNDNISKNLHPFGMDLNVKSNRSSVISQDQSP